MNCNCIKETDAQLKENGHNVRVAGYMLTLPGFKARIVISSEWVDKSKVAKKDIKHPPPIIAGFCPFCGKPAGDLSTEKPKGN